MSNATANTIAHITEVVTRVTRILSGKQIKVVQQGMKVGVDYDAEGRPAAVYLPSLTENPSPELLIAIQGFLDKEVSTLLYTDFDARQRNQVGDFKKGMAKSLQDIIEDSRTEREMRKQFKGSASNFDANHDFAVKEILGPSLAAAKNSNQRTAGLAFPAIRAACGDLAYEEFMDGKWEELGKLGGAILHYADEIQNVSSTEETFDLTRKIIQKMEEGDGDGDDDSEGDGEGEGEGNGSGAGAGAGGSGSGSEDGSGDDAGDPGDEAGKEGGESEDDPADGDKTPPPEQDKVDLSKANKSKKINEAKKSKPSGMSGTSSGIAQFKDLDDAFEDMDFDQKMQDKIKKIAGTDAAGQGAYTPYTRQFDYVGPLPGIPAALKNYSNSTHAKNIIDNVDKNSHVIQQQIQKLFMAREMVRWEPGHKRGKINTASLYRLPQGDPRIFRRKIETNGRDVAVSLVIDMSGSMSGAKIQNACIAALMFSKVLSALNIKHEISAFTTYSGWGAQSGLPDSTEVNKMMRETAHHDKTPDGKQIIYARVTPITNYILKGYNDRMTEDGRRATAMIPSGYPGLMSGNVDGESVEIAGRRLLAQKEKKKVMIVMSDGQPAADGYGGDLVGHLKSVVKNLTASGVEMLGLGLQDRSVSKFYPKFEIVEATDQIPTKILELTRKMVVGV